MKECNMQTLFSRWIQENPPTESAVFELKICKQKSLPYSRIEEHQLESLYNAKHSFSYHKLSDMSREKKPYDCYIVVGVKAFLVVWFYKPREAKEFIFIDIDILLSEISLSPRKSLTEERAKEIGTIYCL
jgi:penicillin-binding protein-related factor A (putative recombinase)